jgi:hypothetical protein
MKGGGRIVWDLHELAFGNTLALEKLEDFSPSPTESDADPIPLIW